MTGKDIPGNNPIPGLARLELDVFNTLDFEHLQTELIRFLEQSGGYLDTRLPLTLAQETALADFIASYMAPVRGLAVSHVIRAYALGQVLNAVRGRKGRVQMRVLPDSVGQVMQVFPEADERRLNLLKQHIGNEVQNVADRTRAMVQRTIIDGHMARSGNRSLEQQLRDTLDATRDWRRLAISETNKASNLGYADAVLAKGSGRKVKFLAYPNACGYCRSLDGKVLTLLEGPLVDYSEFEPGSDQYQELAAGWDTMIWPGKSNVGRSSSPRTADGRDREHHERWTPVIPGLHPHCRCRLVETG